MKRRAMLAVIAVLATTVFAACGKKPAEAESVVAPVTSEETVIASEVIEETPSEAAEPAVEISSSEYLAEYPVPGNDILVYFKLAPEIHFNPDAEDSTAGYTYGEYYTNSFNSDIGLAEVVCLVDEASKAHVVFTCNPVYSAEFFKKNADVGLFGDGKSTFTVSEPETCENGFKIYTVKTDFGSGAVSTQYLLEYQIDENNLFQIYTAGFDEAFSEPVYQDELKSILDYYRTEKDFILVMDKDTPVNIVP